jgi:hypothetical protein
LGDGTNTDRKTPISITTKRWRSISAGRLQSFAIDQDGEMWVWGHNGDAQLGDGTKVDKNTPIPLDCPMVSIEPLATAPPLAFPNPTTGRITVTPPNHFAPPVNITVTNVYGQIVLQQPFSPGASVDLSATPPGLYIIRLESATGQDITQGISKL